MDNRYGLKESKNSITPYANDFNDVTEMLELGMEDYEIAMELGVTDNDVAKLKREYYNDY